MVRSSLETLSGHHITELSRASKIPNPLGGRDSRSKCPDVAFQRSVYLATVYNFHLLFRVGRGVVMDSDSRSQEMRLPSQLRVSFHPLCRNLSSVLVDGIRHRIKGAARLFPAPASCSCVRLRVFLVLK